MIDATKYLAEITLRTEKPVADTAEVVINSSDTYIIVRISNDTAVQTSNTIEARSDANSAPHSLMHNLKAGSRLAILV